MFSQYPVPPVEIFTNNKFSEGKKEVLSHKLRLLTF